MATILALLLLFCMVAQAIDDDPPRVIIDEKRYTDLLEKPYDRRILGVMFHVGNGAGAYIFTEEEQADRRWFHEQGPKAFPVLLEILKREPSPVDSPGSPEAWHGLARSTRILDWVSHFPEGKFGPFVEEVRLQVVRLKGLPNQDYFQSNYLREAFDLLAGKGDESDIHLMEQFLDDEDVGNRDSARGSIAKLKARLEAEKTKLSSPAQDGAVASQGTPPAASSGNSATQSPGSGSPPERSVPLWLRWAFSFLMLAGILWHWRWRAKRKQTVGGAAK